MSNNQDIPGLEGFDAEAFGLPTGAGGGQSGFMYDDTDLSVDANDPLYQATVEAMKARGVDVPAPGSETRPPAMPTTGDGETPPTGDGSDVGGTPPPSTDETPPAPPAINEENDETPPPAAPVINDADETPPAPSELAFKVDGADYTLNNEQAEYLLRVNSWLENVPEQVKSQWAGIESGTHVAITAQEHQDLLAAAKAPQVPTPTTGAPDLDMLDDETADYIRSLEARVPKAQQGGTPDAPPQPDTHELQAAFRHQEQQRTVMMAELEVTNTSVKEQYQLTDDQMTQLERVTTELNIIPRLSQQLTQYSPTGQVIRQAPFGEVVQRAYDIAMSQDPALRQIRDEMIYNARVAKDSERNQATNSKKAKAATLASTPSAAVPANGKGPQVSPDNKMDLQATSAAIADALSKMSEQS